MKSIEMSKPTYLQLGRYGDILSLIPAIQAEHPNGARLIVSTEYSDIVRGMKGIEPVIVNCDFRDITQAMRLIEGSIPAQVIGNEVEIAQVYAKHRPKGNSPMVMESFAKESWHLAGLDHHWRNNPPLQVNYKPSRSLKDLMADYGFCKGDKYLVGFTKGHSSPFRNHELLNSLIPNRYPVIWNPQAPSLLDLYELIGSAEAIISIDSAPLHFAQAFPDKPVIALIADEPTQWHGTAMRHNHFAYVRYNQLAAHGWRIMEALDKLYQFYKSDFLHVYAYHNGGYEAHERHRVAKATWRLEYDNGWKPFPYTDSHIGGNQAILGNKKMPTIHHMLRLACLQCSHEQQIIVLTNDDTCFFPDISGEIQQAVKDHGAIYGARQDFEGEPRVIHKPEGGRKYVGSDIFAFTKEWWQKNQLDYPDMYVGREAWDWIMREFIREKGGKELDGLVYHFRHNTVWETERDTCPYNQHNQKTAREWLNKRGMPLNELIYAGAGTLNRP